MSLQADRLKRIKPSLTVSINVKANALRAEGKNVLVVSLEMSEMIYCKRITSKLTGLPVNHLDDHIEEL